MQHLFHQFALSLAQFVDPRTQGVGGHVDALDRIHAPFQLLLAFLDLRFERVHHRLEPAFGVAIGDFKRLLDAPGDDAEKLARQRLLVVGDHRQRAKTFFETGLHPFQLFQVAQHRVGRRRCQFQAVFRGKFLVHRVDHFGDVGDHAV